MWHFYSEPDKDCEAHEPVLPAGSLLTRWQARAMSADKQGIAEELQRCWRAPGPGPARDSPDGALYRQLTSLNGPLLDSFLRKSRARAQAIHAGRKEESRTPPPMNWGLDRRCLARIPERRHNRGTSLCVRAPSVIEVRLPAELVRAANSWPQPTGQPETGAEGSVQMQTLSARPPALGTWLAGVAREQRRQGHLV